MFISQASSDLHPGAPKPSTPEKCKKHVPARALRAENAAGFPPPNVRAQGSTVSLRWIASTRTKTLLLQKL